MTTLSDTLTFLGRSVLALVAVVTLIWFLAKRAMRTGKTPTGPGVKVLTRAATGRHTAVTVVAVGTRRFLLGVSDQQVNLLTELGPGPDLSAPALPAPVAAGSAGPAKGTGLDGVVFSAHLASATATVNGAARPAPSGALAGSVLSPATWKAATAALVGLVRR